MIVPWIERKLDFRISLFFNVLVITFESEGFNDN